MITRQNIEQALNAAATARAAHDTTARAASAKLAAARDDLATAKAELVTSECGAAAAKAYLTAAATEAVAIAYIEALGAMVPKLDGAVKDARAAQHALFSMSMLIGGSRVDANMKPWGIAERLAGAARGAYRGALNQWRPGDGKAVRCLVIDTAEHATGDIVEAALQGLGLAVVHSFGTPIRKQSRYRIIVPLASPLPVDEAALAVAELTRRIGANGLPVAPAEGSSFPLPAAAVEPHLASDVRMVGRHAIDVDGLIAEANKPKRKQRGKAA